VRKVCVVITARPSYARIRSLLYAVREHKDLELQLVVAASALLDRYGSADKVIESEGFHIDRRVYMILEGENPVTSAKSTGLGVTELATVFDNLQPDFVVTIADRFETIATAIAASYMHIPLVHVQGGEVTGSIDEKVRHAITKLADIHCVSGEQAAQRVIKMGEDPQQVYITGCPSIDLAMQARENQDESLEHVAEQLGGVGANVDLAKPYIIVMQHPVTTEYKQARIHIEQTLQAIQECQIPTLWFWPNVDAGSDGTSKGIRAFRENNPTNHIHFVKNLPPESFIQLLNRSQCIVGNSSVGIRESTYIGAPSVNIGSRQNGRDRGENVMDVAYSSEEIKSALQAQIKHGKYLSNPLYGNGQAGERIAQAIANASTNTEKTLRY
jgi:UDP-hydrolysing UDP-N-acetyl-D-glucosamine 2-epimerase|tara:strand:- start:708 stop:1862 length:1155 start_codon:yes stop_codon:yes gene_type:complete